MDNKDVDDLLFSDKVNELNLTVSNYRVPMSFFSIMYYVILGFGVNAAIGSPLTYFTVSIWSILAINFIAPYFANILLERTVKKYITNNIEELFEQGVGKITFYLFSCRVDLKWGNDDHKKVKTEVLK